MIDPTFLEDLLAGFALKLILNAISTGANILKGLVFGNRMINLTVANDKVLIHSCITVLASVMSFHSLLLCVQLFHRSMLIIAELAGVGEEAAKVALLRAIYRDDHIDKASVYYMFL